MERPPGRNDGLQVEERRHGRLGAALPMAGRKVEAQKEKRQTGDGHRAGVCLPSDVTGRDGAEAGHAGVLSRRLMPRTA